MMTTMKRVLFSCLLAIAVFPMMADSLTLRNLFVAMPDSLIPYLSKNNRLDFIDFIESNMKAEVTNELGGKSQMTALADDSISIQLNDACHVDLLLLNTTEEVDSTRQVIAFVRTIGLENEDRECVVEFFSVKWNKLTVAPPLPISDEKRLLTRLKVLNTLDYLQKKLNK